METNGKCMDKNGTKNGIIRHGIIEKMDNSEKKRVK